MNPGGDMSRSKIYAGAGALCLLAAMALPAQAPSMTDMYVKIKAEETNNSKIMWIIHEVADVHGPRVTGTPGLKAADDWAVATMKSWGLSNVHLEPWTFQPPSAAAPAPGWDNLLLQADAVRPFHGQVIVKPLAWTPSTNGLVESSVVMLTPPGLGGIGAAGRGGGGGGRTRRCRGPATANLRRNRLGGATEPCRRNACYSSIHADEGRAGRVSGFDEGESCRTHRDGRQPCGSCRELLSGAAAQDRGTMESAVRSE